MRTSARIIISPTGKGRYAAQLGDCVLVASARTPLLDSARVLMAEGHDPDTMLEMQHKPAPPLWACTAGWASSPP